DRLALGAQRDEKGRRLDLRGAALHDLVEHRRGMVRREMRSGANGVDRPGDDVVGHQASVRKFRRMSLPLGVSTDSGWNWTPSAGRLLCRTPITTLPSVAVSSSSAGSSGSATSEW